MKPNIFRRFLNRVTSFTNPYRGVVFFGNRQLPGVYLNAYEALRLSAVWACVSVISKTLAASTWEIYRENANGDRDYQRNSKTFQLLNRRPNPEMTPFAFHEAQYVKALIWGASYAEIELDVMGRPANLWPLDSERCTLVRGFLSRDNEFTYDWAKGTLYVRHINLYQQTTYLPYELVYHIHGLSLDGTCALDMVSVASKSLLMMMASETFRLKFYENGTSLGGVLSTEKDLSQDDLDELKKKINDRVGGVENAFQFLVLGGGLKWESLTPDFDKAQFVEQNNFMIEEVCRYWGVPPHMIAHLLRATFSNIEHLGIEFKRQGLTPWAKRGEQEIDYKILPDVGNFSVQLDLDWTAEGDMKTQAETASILVQNGLQKRNEWRRKKGLNSLGPDGDAITIQANMTTIDRVIKGENTQQQPGGQQPERVPGKPAPLRQANETARALFYNAVKRSLQRQTNRTQQAVAVHNRDRFEKWLDASKVTQLAYMRAQIQDAVDTLERLEIFINFNVSVIEKACDEDKALLLAAFDKRELASWCDIEERANQITNLFEISIEGETHV